MTESSLAESVSYETERTAWRLERHRQLSGPTGPLTITALEWLVPEPTTYSSIPGIWWADHDTVRLDPAGDVIVHSGNPVTGTVRFPLADGGSSVRLETAAGVEIEVFRRGGFMAVVRNPASELLHRFDGVQLFPDDPGLVLTGTFEAEPGNTLTVRSTRGPDQDLTVIGRVRFVRSGFHYDLPVNAGHNGVAAFLSLLFTDDTNGTTTYPAGRFVVLEPSDDGSVVVDFNRAVNLPCAFNPLISCPVPPVGSRLPFAVKAGERYPIP